MVKTSFRFSFLAAAWGVKPCLALRFQNHGVKSRFYNFVNLIAEVFRPRINATVDRHALLASGQSTFVLLNSPIRAMQIRPEQSTVHSSRARFHA